MDTKINQARKFLEHKDKVLLNVLFRGRELQHLDEGRRIIINWVFPEPARPYVLNLENCALTYLADRRSERADATVVLERGALDRLLLRELTLADAMQSGSVRVDGDVVQVEELLGMLDNFSLMFEVVEPKRPA